MWARKHDRFDTGRRKPITHLLHGPARCHGTIGVIAEDRDQGKTVRQNRRGNQWHSISPALSLTRVRSKRLLEPKAPPEKHAFLSPETPV
jgi:hypothetical protein